MSEKNMILINKIMYYVICPLLVLEFVLVDFGIMKFFGMFHSLTLVVFVAFMIAIGMYKKSHPKFDYKVNPVYEKVIFILIMLEFLFVNGYTSMH